MSEIELKRKSLEDLQQTIVELVLRNIQLEKALDKACNYLERVNIQDCNVFDEYDDIPDIAYSFDENQWKEQCMKDDE